MKKILIQGIITIGIFFSIWFVFTQINWVEILKIQKATDKTEEKLGNLFLDIFKNSESENKSIIVNNTIDTIITKICSQNNIDRESIKFYVLNNSEINAFALPNGNLIIYSGLILNVENQEELAGVICHELAHIQLNHVMKKLTKEIGLSVLISMTTGSGNSEIIKETAKMLSSTAFDRKLEKDADIKAVDYLINAQINPEPFADFLYKISEKEHESLKYLTWISTHPDSKLRAKYILDYSKDKKQVHKTIIELSTWKKLIDELKE